MKTIESILLQLTTPSIVEDLRQVLREKDPEFLPVEAKFKESVSKLANRIGKTATQALVTAWDRQICSDLVYAGYLGFQANLHNFHNPVASQFTRLDYETFLREHIMQTMPYRSEAETAAEDKEDKMIVVDTSYDETRLDKIILVTDSAAIKSDCKDYKVWCSFNTGFFNDYYGSLYRGILRIS